MMKKKNQLLSLIVMMFMVAVFAAGCGSATREYANTAASVAMDAGSGMYDSIYEAAPMEAAAAEEAAEMPEAEAMKAETPDAEQADQDTGRKLIKNVNMSVETESFDALMANIENKVESMGGYIEQSDIYNGSYTSNYRSRNANLTIRVPAEKLDTFVDDVAAQSNITNKSESVEDVTLQYVDLDSHKKALRAEEESLLMMLEKAESIEDIIAIQSQLTDVRYQIESMESQLRTYDNKIEYSTVWLYIEEVAQYEPYEPKTTGERITEGFMRNVHNVTDGMQNFFIELVIAIPLILTAAVIIGIGIVVLVLIVRVSEKQTKKRKEKRELKQGTEKDRRPDADK